MVVKKKELKFRNNTLLKRKLMNVFAGSIVLAMLSIAMFSCDHEIKCSNLNYDSLGLDTNQMLNDQVFIFESDTIILESRSRIRNNLNSEPSFFTQDECDNGIYLDYSNDDLDFNFSYYFITREEATKIEVYYGSYYFETLEYYNQTNLLGIDTILYASPENPKVHEIHIENGIFVAFKDYRGKLWKLNKSQ